MTALSAPPPPKIRLFVDAPLAAGAAPALSAEQSHYLLHVMRAQPGSEVALFNGRDGEWRAVLVEAGKRVARLAVSTLLRPQRPEPDLWLVFAPVKRARIDIIAEKATELGVSALVPVLTRHTAAGRVNEQRLRSIAVEAAEQSQRLTVPEVFGYRPLDAVLADWPKERRLILLDETGGGQSVAEAFSGGAAEPAALLVGPEGGFAKSELDAIGGLAFASSIGLGPRILRADTAVIAALACFQALCGDWRSHPPSRN
jgi:16S rRNA (uracil1498-N3)-methyltransferase